MTEDSDRWAALADPTQVSERKWLTAAACQAASRTFLAEVSAQVEREMDVVLASALRQADSYIEASRDVQAIGTKAEQSHITTRVRRQNNALSAEWSRIHFVSQGAGTKKRLISTYIKKGTRPSYSMAPFGKEPQWARDLIASIEQDYSRLRRRSAVLVRLRKALGDYEKILNEDQADSNNDT